MDWVTVLSSLIGGYISVPLAALAMRKSWPSKVRFFLAGAISVGIAYGALELSNEPFTALAFLAALGIAFPMQQATFHLELPFAGSPVVVERMEAVRG